MIAPWKAAERQVSTPQSAGEATRPARTIAAPAAKYPALLARKAIFSRTESTLPTLSADGDELDTRRIWSGM